MEETLKLLKEIYDSGDASVVLENGSIPDDEDSTDFVPISGSDATNTLYISDFVLDQHNKIAKLLIVRGDPDVSDPAFTNSKTRKIEVISPDEDQALAYSTHVLIGYGGKFAKVDGCRACIEKMTNVSRSLVFPFLNYLLRRHANGNADFFFDANTKKREKAKKKKYDEEMKQFYPRIRTTGKTSASLRNDIKQGHVTSIALIDRKAAYQGPDASHYVKEATRKLQLKVSPPDDDNAFFKFIKKLAEHGKVEGYDEIQVKVEGMPGDKSVSPRFSLDVADAADSLYVRSERIADFGQPLAQCVADLYQPVVKKMIVLLEKDGLWSG